MLALDALRFVIAIGLVLILTSRFRLHPLIGLLAGVSIFPITGGLPLPYFVDLVGKGFAQTWQETGLAVLAGALAHAFIARGDLGPHLATLIIGGASGKWQGIGAPRRMAVLGIVAGLSPSVGAAFSLLLPLVRIVSERLSRSSHGAALGLGLTMLTSHTLLIPAPGPIAAMTVLSANMLSALALGLPVAVVSLLVGRLALPLLCRFAAAETGGAPPAPAKADSVIAAPGMARRLLRCWVALAVLLPVALALCPSVGSLAGQLVGNPFGYSIPRALGSPVLALITITLSMLCLLWYTAQSSPAKTANLAIVLATIEAAPLLVLIGAGGALAKVLQMTGIAEAAGEYILGWNLGLAVPFLIAVVFKTVQGSSWVAIIATAGFVEPMLSGLGLAADIDRALAVIAIGAGAMVASHFNDPLFWLVAGAAGVSPATGCRTFSLLTAIQGLTAFATVLLLAAVSG